MSWRKLQLGKETYLYVVGKKGVKIRNPQNKVSWIEAWKILKYESKKAYIREIYRVDDDGDGRYNPSITPQNIKDYIENSSEIESKI